MSQLVASSKLRATVAGTPVRLWKSATLSSSLIVSQRKSVITTNVSACVTPLAPIETQVATRAASDRDDLPRAKR